MVAISSSFVILAVLASAMAAPVVVSRDSDDALVELDILGDDQAQNGPIDAGLLGDEDPDCDGDDGDDDDTPLVDGDDDASLLDAVIGRRAAQTTGDLIAGVDSDDSAVLFGPGFWRLRRSAHDEDASLLDVDLELGGQDHHAHYVDGATAASVAAASAASSSPEPSSPSNSASRRKSTLSTSSSLTFDPSGIKENAAVGSKSSKSKAGVKSKSKSKSKPQHKAQIKASIGGKSKSKAESKTHASAGSTSNPAFAVISLGGHATSTPTPTPVPSAPTTVYYTHSDNYDSLLDIDLNLKI